MQLCQLPTCRIRGRHLPTCEGDCAGCLPRIADEGLCCDACLARAERHLAEIIALAPDARLVAQGLVRRGSGGGSGKPASRPPLNADALDALDEVTNALTTLARMIADERGLTFGSDGPRARLSAPVAAQQPSLVPTATLTPEEAI